jgi:hypothetical protein
LFEKIKLLFEDWTPCLAALLWQGALRSSRSNIDFIWRLAKEVSPGRAHRDGAQLTIDEIAERVLTLGKPPHSRFADYISESSIKEINTIGLKDLDMVDAILDDMYQLIQLERELLEATDKAGDDGTNDMVNRFMQFKEKNTWMLRSFANKK